MDAQVVEKVSTISDVASEAVSSASGDQKKATQIMVRRVRRDDALYRLLFDDLLESACREQVGAVIRARRGTVWNAPNYDPGGNGERVKALAYGNGLMFFQLPGGPILGQATRAEVAEAAEFYSKQACDMAWKARWLKLIAQRVADGKTVAKSLTEQQLLKLQEQCRG